MTEQRQKVFLKLKSPCVNLSAVALKFRAGDAPVKDVLKALEAVKAVLEDVGPAGLLDPKLSEYALFPLAQQVFNETRRLSPRCLEIASQCVTLLVKYGYRQSLLPELGKQLLILMSMLAGAGPTQENEQTPDELKIAAFECIFAVIEALVSSVDGASIFEDQGTKNVVDQLVYLLLDAITNSFSDQVQLEASHVLTILVTTIQSRVFLASLLPRTVSALTKALRPSTKARRTQKVLTTNLKALRVIISRTLSDTLAIDPTVTEEKDILDKPWLTATVGQIKSALLQVVKLRTQESASVRRELEQLCVMVMEDCHTTLVDSIPVVLETMVVLSAQLDGEQARLTTKHLLTVYPDTAETLMASFNNMCESLPRLMQSHDEQNKSKALQRFTATLQLLPGQELELEIEDNNFIPALINSISNIVQATPNRAVEINDTLSLTTALDTSVSGRSSNFQQFILNHESQKDTSRELRAFLAALAQSSVQSTVVRRLIDVVADSDGITKLSAFWLALKLLNKNESNMLDTQEWFSMADHEDQSVTRSSLISDLYVYTLPLLANVFDEQSVNQYIWQMQALAMESVVMYAQTFPGDSYRPELMNTLYPVLSFLGSPNSILRSHSINALNGLAQACQYTSTKDLLIDNVDYLVNSIAWKLNTYNLSPEAPQILQMMVKLCGAQLIPYLDDLIQSIFAALDNYHGYPQWVELLFSTLKAMVEESKNQPQLAITAGKPLLDHNQMTTTILASTKDDILGDVRLRKRRKLDFDRPADEPPTKAPQRPWTDALDGPTFPTNPESDTALGDDDEENRNDHLAPIKPSSEEEPPPLSRTHSLLLSIAQSTLPHLSSPSPQVRHLLLDLLQDVSPLLSRDETSFLPLINSIWPVLVPRLFAEQALSSPDTKTDTAAEAAYNISAAAETIAVLCIGSGDFMASRIEDISAQLLRLVRATQARVSGFSASSNSSGRQVGSGGGGTVSLDIMKQQREGQHKPGPAAGTSITPFASNYRELRSSQRDILRALLQLLVTVLGHVRLTLDTGDLIMDVLLPYLDDGSLGMDVREVLDGYNSDAVWLFELKRDNLTTGTVSPGKVVEMDQNRGSEVPVLRRELLDMGLSLVTLTV